MIEAVSSSVADATVSTLLEASVDAEAAAVAWRMVSVLLPFRQVLHRAGRHRDGLDDLADLALEAGGEFAPRGIAIVLGAFGLDALGVGARLGGTGGLGLRRLQRRRPEQFGKRVREPDQHAGLDQQDQGVENDATEIGAAGIDRGRQDEIQRQVVQGNRQSAGDDRPIVAIGDEARQRGEEVHVHVDLPAVARELVDQHRHAGHQGHSNDQAG
ncbi:hypothetical protein [Bradyrhizobium pachyrhizi]|uniref:hypothetical protein n=1 Tax=Bradyrhizobium pachyrhizi TaxID=280333 RepID=UPI001FD9EEBB|nr:hypothetical protein [Bradyrhizobium pachyrhizi]